MLRIRPVKESDHAEVTALAKMAGVGMVSLPQDPDVMRHKITDARGSFAGKPRRPHEEKFFFVLEDMEKKCLVGTTGIVAHVGLTRPFYSYKLSIIVQASREPSVYSQNQVLHMVNDYTGVTELGSLFLHPDYRRDGIGKFLSRSRFLMLAEFPDLFSDTVISEIRGVQDKAGRSPFYDNLAKHFFQMEFKDADYIYATQGGQFIADLMPKYPIYVNLLPKEAQDVIGVPLAASKPAMQILTDEGFRYEGYLDLFDAGPTIQAERSRIHTVAESRKVKIAGIQKEIVADTDSFLICNTRLKDFTMTRARLAFNAAGEAILEQSVAAALGVRIGDEVRWVE